MGLVVKTKWELFRHDLLIMCGYWQNFVSSLFCYLCGLYWILHTGVNIYGFKFYHVFFTLRILGELLVGDMLSLERAREPCHSVN